ncbi:MAG TPA: IPT/TIG domain-containing protein [Acidimicrobiales bacterium]|nr:IPT/TIG domain-containing protein [Acidimicrobiales bacterium]
MASVILNVVTVVALVVAAVAGIIVATHHSNLPLPSLTDQAMVFAPDGSIAYVAEDGHVGVEHLKGKKVTTTAQIDVPGGALTHMVITPDGHQLVVSTGSGLFTITLTTAPPAVTLVAAAPVQSLAMAPGGTFALVGTNGNVSRLNFGPGQASLADRFPIGHDIQAIAVAPSNENAFVLFHPTVNGSERLITIHLTQAAITLRGSVNVTGKGLLLSPNGYTAYVGGSVVNVLADPPQLRAPPALPIGVKTLAGFTAQTITPDGRFVYLGGEQLTPTGGIAQVVEDTSTTPPTTSTFGLIDCTSALVNPPGTRVYCGATLSFPVVPSISSLSLASGGIAGGYPITLNGTFLQDATSVSFGTTPGLIGSTNAAGTALSVTVPQGQVGTVPVTVETTGGTSALVPLATFTYNLAPAVSRLSPSRGLVQGGTGVLLGGSGFIMNSTVDFGPGHPGQVLSVTPDGNLMAVRAPAGSGTVDVIVTDAQGSSAPSTTARFTYVKIPPKVLGIKPLSGLSHGGYGILIGGQDLNGATAVNFGVTPARIVNVSIDGEFIGVIVPPGVGTVDVTVTTPSGTSNNVRTDEFTYTG